MIGTIEYMENGQQIKVIIDDYEAPEPMRITGWGFGDAEEGNPEIIEYRVFENGEEFEPMLSQRDKIENLIREFFEEQYYGI